MDTNYRRQFPSFEAAISYLEERGKLQYFGRAGVQYEKFVYTITLRDMRVYRLFVYDSGLVEVIG